MMKRINRLDEVENNKSEEIEDTNTNTEVSDNNDNIKVKKKGKRIIKFIVIFIILLTSLFYYMRFIETNMLFVKEEKITNSNLPKEFHGLKIVHISDIHYKMTTDNKYIKKLVKKINDLNPDIVVFTGDLLDNSLEYNEKELNELSDNLANINTNYKYYVKGNHDYKYDVDSILNKAKFSNLNNKYEYIYRTNNSKIVINGMGSNIQNDFNISTSFDFDDTLYNITILHEPDNISMLSNYSIDLALAGHSHNGQINIPFVSMFKVTGAKKYYKNYYLVNNTPLYINQGIGTSLYKYRLFTPPTINFYRLTSY